MEKAKKIFAFMLAAGLMVSAMVVFADEGNTSTEETPHATYEYAGEIRDNSKGGKDFIGSDAPKYMGENNRWYNTSNGQWYIVSTVINGASSSQSCLAWIPMEDNAGDHDSKSAAEREAEARAAAEQEAERLIQEQASAEAVRLAGAAMDEGFADVGDMYRAAEKSMSAGEFYNNAVVSTPGIENAVTVGQGGNLVVNGQVTNMSASISKVTNRAYVDSVRVDQEGTVLNVVEVSYPATEASINFYMPGVAADAEIAAVQYNAGAWVDVEVAEVRADHVVLNMKGNGVVAFIAK